MDMSIAPFLQKTYEIFSNPLHAKSCGWGDDNDSIVIHNVRADDDECDNMLLLLLLLLLLLNASSRLCID